MDTQRIALRICEGHQGEMKMRITAETVKNESTEMLRFRTNVLMLNGSVEVGKPI